MKVKICGAFYKMSEREGTSISIEKGMGTYLILRFYEPMVIVTDNEEIITEKDAFIIYPPFAKQCYRAVNGGFTNDYVHFLADQDFIKKYELPLNEVFYSDNPQAFSKKIIFITWLLTDIMVDHTRRLDEQFDLALRELKDSIIRLTAKSRREQLMKRQFINLREQVRTNPVGWTVEKMAKKIYLTRSHFSINYKKQFGISPSDDILNFTIEFAKKLLDETDVPIHEIAEKCGYINPNNLTRAFKNVTNITPLQYRKSKKSENEQNYK